MLHVTAWDLLVIWLTPLFFCGFSVWIFSIALYILVVGNFQNNFKGDILHKIEKKKKLRSGARMPSAYFFFLGLLLLDNGVQATLLYRISHFFANKKLHMMASIIHSFSKFLTHIDISPYAKIGAGLTFYHGMGIVIGKFTQIGEYATICQNVTTGNGRPHIGNHVTLWAGAKILGNVQIGDYAQIGANAVVLQDVPANCVAVGVPATRFIPRPPYNQQDIQDE